MTNEQIFSIITAVVTAASIICAALPPGKPGSTLDKINKIVDLLAINIGHAKS